MDASHDGGIPVNINRLSHAFIKYMYAQKGEKKHSSSNEAEWMHFWKIFLVTHFPGHTTVPWKNVIAYHAAHGQANIAGSSHEFTACMKTY